MISLKKRFHQILLQVVCDGKYDKPYPGVQVMMLRMMTITISAALVMIMVKMPCLKSLKLKKFINIQN